MLKRPDPNNHAVVLERVRRVKVEEGVNDGGDMDVYYRRFIIERFIKLVLLSRERLKNLKCGYIRVTPFN
jgi:hypothetical protein